MSPAPEFTASLERLFASLPDVHRLEDGMQSRPGPVPGLSELRNHIWDPNHVVGRWLPYGGASAVTGIGSGRARFVRAGKSATGSNIGVSTIGTTNRSGAEVPVVTLTAEVRLVAGSAVTRVSFIGRDDTNNDSSALRLKSNPASAVFSQLMPLSGPWTRIFVVGTLADNRTLERVYLQGHRADGSAADLTTADNFDLRNFMILDGEYDASTLPPYFDGDSTAAEQGYDSRTPDSTWRWEGAAYGSSSVRGPLAADPGGFPMKRLLAAVGDQLGAVDALLSRIDFEPRDSREFASQATSALADPNAADAAWLPWLAQLVGVRLSKAQTEAQRRAAIASAGGGFRGGTKRALVAAAQTVLTGAKSVAVYDHSITVPGDGGEWDVLLVTRGSETPVTSAQLLAAVAAADGKPAGVVLRHKTFDSTWDAVEAGKPTWAQWDASTWQQIEETGIS